MNEKGKSTIEKASRDMALHFYKMTAKFPADEREGISQDIRNRALEICDLLVIGVTKDNGDHLVSFIERAEDPKALLETTLVIAAGMGHLSEPDLEKAREAVEKLQAVCEKVSGKKEKPSAGFEL